MSRRRGFTIAELAFVLAVMGLVASLTIPAGEVLVRRARADEANAMLWAISQQELQHWRDTGQFLACPAEGDVPRAPVAFPTSECWKTLGVTTSGLVRYRYAVEVKDGHYIAIAEGDLNADGVTSEFRLDGRSQAMSIRGALE